MGAAAHQQPRFSVRISKQTQLIGSDPGGIDDHASVPALLLALWPFADSGTEAAICTFKANNPAIPHHFQARLCRRGCTLAPPFYMRLEHSQLVSDKTGLAGGDEGGNDE